VRRIAFEDSNFLVVNKPFDLQVDGARPLTLEKMIREARC
jgi:23S rRNA-/tRNA-specific pseudouridylate synthase